MKIRLFHAPYVDDSGIERKRLCAFVVNAPADDEIRQVLKEIKAGLAKCEVEATAIALSSDIEVEWL